MKYIIFTLISCLFASSSIVAQTSSNELTNLRLTKIDNQGKEVVFTVSDAIQLVRFFNAQSGVKFCKSDPQKNTLKIVGDTGTDIQQMLNNSLILSEISKMGYKVDIATIKPPSKPVIQTLAKEDCADCGDVDLNQSSVEDMLKNSDYGGDEIIIDLGGNSDPFGSDPFSSSTDPFSTGGGTPDFTVPQMSQSQIDSLQKLFNGGIKPDN
ncbi:MAG: hypothetical protein R3E32_04825 [Chitinophagales bacterium]